MTNPKFNDTNFLVKNLKHQILGNKKQKIRKEKLNLNI